VQQADRFPKLGVGVFQASKVAHRIRHRVAMFAQTLRLHPLVQNIESPFHQHRAIEGRGARLSRISRGALLQSALRSVGCRADKSATLNTHLVRWAARARQRLLTQVRRQSLLNCSAHDDGFGALVGNLETESFEESHGGTIRPDAH
jgi:hypothetical protein